MKGFLKGVKHFMKNSTEKIVENVDKVLWTRSSAVKLVLLLSVSALALS